MISLVAEHRLWECGLQELWLVDSVVSAPKPRSTGWGVASWHVGSSQTRDQTVTPALASGFFTTQPPGSP